MRRFETAAAVLGGLLLLGVALSNGAYHRHGRGGYAAAAQGEVEEDEDLDGSDGSDDESYDEQLEQDVFWDEGDSANNVGEEEGKEEAEALEERQGFYNVPYYWYWR